MTVPEGCRAEINDILIKRTFAQYHAQTHYPRIKVFSCVNPTGLGYIDEPDRSGLFYLDQNNTPMTGNIQISGSELKKHTFVKVAPQNIKPSVHWFKDRHLACLNFDLSAEYEQSSSTCQNDNLNEPKPLRVDDQKLLITGFSAHCASNRLTLPIPQGKDPVSYKSAVSRNNKKIRFPTVDDPGVYQELMMIYTIVALEIAFLTGAALIY
ncbi:hypothetical protein [Endozoicomonas numazuensis]|uniref:hypothetical protein n=1 Tax=Endozoicomonas numazuensis TaxID=1137799 RepID=UPI001268932C|nr:hypothetical protein [Endozoicomonas numazuensis]